MLSELLDGEELPNSLNEAIYALMQGRAFVVERDTDNPGAGHG